MSNLLYRIEVKDVPAQDVGVIAARVPAGEIGEWLRAAIGELIAVAGQRGTGPPFAVVPDADAEGIVDVEAVLPVVASMPPSGRIERRGDPAYRAIVALHHGSHDDLPTIRVMLRQAMRRQGSPPRARRATSI